MKKFFFGFLLLFLQVCWATLSAETSVTPDQTIWFKYPAIDWSKQTLHIGNGYMGASFYGDVKKERLDIAEKTFWIGGPHATPNYNFGNKAGGKEKIALIREKIVNHQFAEADSLCRIHMTGDYTGYGYFSTVGNLELDFKHDDSSVTDYIRGLDLANSVGFVSYKQNNVTYKRNYFCSYPDKALVLHLTADQKNKISFQLSHLLTYQPDKTEQIPNGLVFTGLIKGNGLRYCIRMQVVPKGGKVTVTNNQIQIDLADEATIYYVVDTDYRHQYPTFKGEDPVKTTQKRLKDVVDGGYETVKERHIRDYKHLYDRVKLSLVGDAQLEKRPTNERVEELQKGCTDDASLKALWFNLSRYLIISASRKGTLPSTLQGVWNTFEQAPWSGNFQSNINLQEMYWGCGPTNLPECQEAYVEWVEGLVEPGRKTATQYYGTKGWVSNATGNIWGFTAPGSDIIWGIYPVAAAWHCRHLWEQYAFTGDKQYLKNRAYPVMREAALFWLENMVEYGNHYIIAPTVSAEHGVEMKDGKPVNYSTTNGESSKDKVFTVPAFQDVEMVYDLYTNVIAATEVLETDADFRKKVKETRDKLVPLKTGKYGQLQEWVEDADNPRDHHRHIAHLYALYPGNMISPDRTPELSQAVKRSLELRGEGKQGDQWPHAGGNWSMAWRSALWTRLKDGDRAMRIFNLMIRESGYENMLSNQSGNVMVDAPMATSGIFSEMLLQSQDGFIDLLPALPTEWSEGKVEGLVARQGYKINIVWKYGQLTRAEITIPNHAFQPIVKVKGGNITPNDKRIVFIKANK